MTKAALGLLLGIALALPAVAHASDDAYYRQFLYEIGAPNADGNISYRYLMGFNFDVGTYQGKKVVGSMDLALQADGSYLIRYSEQTDDYMPIVMFMKIPGQWSVPADKLLLGDVAEGSRAVVDGQNAVKLHFLKDLNTAGLQGRDVTLAYGFANYPIDNP